MCRESYMTPTRQPVSWRLSNPHSGRDQEGGMETARKKTPQYTKDKTVSCSPGCPQTHEVARNTFELVVEGRKDMHSSAFPEASVLTGAAVLGNPWRTPPTRQH